MLDACLKFLNIWGGIWIRVNIDNYVPYKRILKFSFKISTCLFSRSFKFKMVRPSKKEKDFKFQ